MLKVVGAVLVELKLAHQGVHHKPFLFDEILRGRNSPPKSLDDLYHYFEIGGPQSTVQGAAELHRDLLSKTEAHFTNTPYAGIAAHWLRLGRLQGLHLLSLSYHVPGLQTFA